MKIDKLIFFFFLLFLFSPATSVLKLMGTGYFPNEKLSFLIALICVVTQRKTINAQKINTQFMYLYILITIIFLVCTFVHSLQEINIIYDINLIYLFLAMPVYLTYFSSQKFNISSVFPIIVFLQLIFSAFQQVSTFNDPSWVNVLNNYPMQQYYSFPSNEMGAFRTSGLFNESSQYAAFMILYIMFFLEGVVKKNLLNYVLLLLALVDVFVSQSITAFLMLGVYILFAFFYYINSKNVIGISALAFLSYYAIHDVLSSKIAVTLSADNSGYPRLINAIHEIEKMFHSQPIFGMGLSWDSPTWDFLSVYFSGYGLLGGFASLFFILLVMIKLPSWLRFTWPVFLLTNGHFLVSLNIFFILFALSSTAPRPSLFKV